jgi:hypothetical protein
MKFAHGCCMVLDAVRREYCAPFPQGLWVCCHRRDLRAAVLAVGSPVRRDRARSPHGSVGDCATAALYGLVLLSGSGATGPRTGPDRFVSGVHARVKASRVGTRLGC